MSINLQEIKKVLSESKSISYAIIFGSSITNLLPESDVDILIGGQLNFSERTDLAIELEQILKRKIDIVLTKDASPELALKAFSSGSLFLRNNKEDLKKDYFKNFYLYEDNRNLRKLRISRIKRRYNHG